MSLLSICDFLYIKTYFTTTNSPLPPEAPVVSNVLCVCTATPIYLQGLSGISKNNYSFVWPIANLYREFSLFAKLTSF